MTILIARWQNCHGLTNWHNSPKSPSWSSCTPSAQGKRTENWFSFALRDSGLAEVTLFLMAHGKLPQLSDAQQPVTAHPLCLEVCWAMEKWPKPSALTHRAGQGKTEAEMDAGTSGKKRDRLSDTTSFSSTQFWEPASAVAIKWIHRVNPQRALPIPVSDPSSLLCIAGIPVGPWSTTGRCVIFDKHFANLTAFVGFLHLILLYDSGVIKEFFYLHMIVALWINYCYFPDCLYQ